MNTVGSARRKEAMHALNPFAPGAGRQPKELVGREQELEIMDRIIARTKAGCVLSSWSRPFRRFF